MSNITKTYSGDFSSFIAGKLLNAAGMAKSESDRRQTENLEKARPGSLFARALQSEFGGDLYNRTLGNFDPRKSADETDRKSTKEKRYQAQFGDLKKTPKSDLDDAEKELLKDDDSIPVKDVGSRENITKVLGVGLDARITLADARVTGLSNDVGSIRNSLIDTQKLIYDQNEMLGSRFDQILEIFSAQKDYQQKIADKAEVARRENELELEKDLSTTKKLESTFGKKTSGIKLGDLFGTIGDLLKGSGFRGKKLAQTAKDFLSFLGSPDFRKKGSRALGGFSRRVMSGALYGSDARRARFRKLVTGRGNKFGLFGTIASNPGLYLDFLYRDAEDNLGDRKFLRQIFGKKKDIRQPRKGSKFDRARADFMQRSTADVMQGIRTDSLEEAIFGRSKNKFTKRGASAAVDSALKKGGTEIGQEVAEQAVKKGAKKSLKLVPGLGTAIALGEAFFRWQEGDTTGAVLSLASAIPIAGWAFTAVDIARDMGLNPLGLPEAPQYERGTTLTRPGPAILHGTEAVIGPKDRKDMNNSYQQAIDQVGSTLVSSAVSLGEAAGRGQEIKSELKKTGLNYEIVSFPTTTDIGGTGNLSVLSSLERDFNREIFSKRKQEQEDEIETEEKPSDDDGDDKGGGGNPPAAAPRTTPRLGGNGNLWNANLPANAVTFDSQQGIDASNDPGVDFSFNDIYKNYSVFDGTVVEVGNGLYGAGYGGVVVIRSKDPNDPTKEFDALYAHFAPGTQAVVEGQSIKAGDYIGPVGWVGQWPGGHPAPGAGGMTGPHTSLDFFEPNDKRGQITGPYSGKSGLQQYVLNLAGKTPTSSVSGPIVPPPPKQKIGPGSEPGGGKGGNPPPYRGIGGYGLRPDGTSGMNKVGDTIKGHDGKDYKLVPRKGYGYNQWVPVKLAMGMNPMVGRGRGIGGPDKPVFRNSMERRVYAALNSKGFTAAQIAAIMANFDVETMGFTTMKQLGGGPGRGLAQWETPGRWDQALEWYASQGKDPSKLINDVEGQIDWMMHEFTNIPTDSQGRPNLPYGFGYNLSDWKASSKDPAELSLNWMNWYEAPGVPHAEQRAKSAERYGKMFPRSQGEIDAQIRKNEADKLKYKDDPASFFGTNLSSSSNRMNSLFANSSTAEEMEDMVIQQVYIINTTVASNANAPIITSSKSSTDHIDQYRMAVLGA